MEHAPRASVPEPVHSDEEPPIGTVASIVVTFCRLAPSRSQTPSVPIVGFDCGFWARATFDTRLSGRRRLSRYD
jgi:hypothetical protein